MYYLYPLYYDYPAIYTQHLNRRNTFKNMYRKKKSKHYNPGINETLDLIGCYNPYVLEAITKCSIPYFKAKKIVRKMIDHIVC
ncbi:MAG TPA: hypothetical protein DD426_06015 [Clostridiaceae bacterium]|nr:hypothetical protein [Clostridiaceae bacterium]